MQTHNFSFCLADVQEACKDAGVNAKACMQLLAAAALINKPLESTLPQAIKGFQPSLPSATSKQVEAKEHQSSKAAEVLPQSQLARATWEIYQYAVSEKFELTAAAMMGLYEILSATGDIHIPSCLVRCEGVACHSLATKVKPM